MRLNWCIGGKLRRLDVHNCQSSVEPDRWWSSYCQTAGSAAAALLSQAASVISVITFAQMSHNDLQ